MSRHLLAENCQIYRGSLFVQHSDSMLAKANEERVSAATVSGIVLLAVQVGVRLDVHSRLHLSPAFPESASRSLHFQAGHLALHAASGTDETSATGKVSFSPDATLYLISSKISQFDQGFALATLAGEYVGGYSADRCRADSPYSFLIGFRELGVRMLNKGNVGWVYTDPAELLKESDYYKLII